MVLGGVAVAGFGTAGVLYALRGSAIAELRAGCAGREVCPDDLRGVRDRGRAEGIGGNVALGVGVVAAVGATIAFLVLRPRGGVVTVTARGSLLVVEGAL